MESKIIKYQDGSTNTAAVFRGNKPSVTIICLPALGVRASYYEAFCEKLCEEGVNVVLVDWRGNGASSIRPSRSNNWGYEQLVLDTKEVCDQTKEWLGDMKTIIVGHSLGGQIGSLLASRYAGQVDGIVLIASCLVHYKGWRGLGKLKVWSVGHLFAWVSRMFGYFPGNKVGFGGREAKDLMLDWGWNARTGQYILRNSAFDYENALASLQVPILALSVAGDTFAPKEATTNLYSKFYTGTPVNHIVITSEEATVERLTHFNWVKHSECFVQRIGAWLTR